MLQYEMDIVYIHGEDNCVMDTLSCVPEGAFPGEEMSSSTPLTPHEAWQHPIGAVLSITTNLSMLESIKASYLSDNFCLRLAQSDMPGAHLVNGLWYIRDRLIIPRTGDICENLFWLAHDTLGHFGANKSYMNLQDAYY